MDLHIGAGTPKNRKRGSKVGDDTEETPFTNPYNVKLQEASSGKQKTPNCLRNTQCYFCEFCDNTSIHGFKFLGERGRYIIEKIWWLFVVIGAVSGSAVLISKTYEKWVTSPVVVTFSTSETPIWRIPFPAITICPEMKVNKTFLNFTSVYRRKLYSENVTEKEELYYDLFSLVCDMSDPDDDSDMTFMDDDTVDTFHEMFADMDVESCHWLNKKYDCKKILKDTITSEGWCRTFNMLDYQDIYNYVDDQLENRTAEDTKDKLWTLEEGYPPTASIDTFPRRTMLAGSKAGFQLELIVNDKNLDYVCTQLQGFKVTLHHPAEEPDMDRHFRIPLDQAVIAGIRPRMITTSEEIRAYSPDDRQCYLPNEKILSTFKIYTQQNCMSECLTNYTLARCGCINFYDSYNDEVERCGPASKGCVDRAKVKFLENDVLAKINKSEVDEVMPQCGCLPSCSSLQFDAETSQTDWDWRKTVTHAFDGVYDEFVEGDHHSKLIVYYKEMQFMTSERHELYGTVDFLANCGGLLGLFCGFSFTSSIEILYFLTLRFICNLKRYGRRVWSGSPELVEEDKQARDKSEFI